MAKTDTSWNEYEVEYKGLIWPFRRKQMALDFISTMMQASGDAECVIRKKVVVEGGEANAVDPFE